MESPDRRRTNFDDLHPLIRNSVRKIIDELKAEGHPFELFEAFRTPARQRHLHAQGRTRPGNIVTKAKAWQSFHQYGLAVDIVLKIKGEWSWNDSGKFARSWDRLHEIGRAHGLKPLSFEKPHLQWAEGDWSDLFAGGYPSGGDESWADNLEAAIIEWTGQGDAPPPPRGVVERPPLQGGQPGPAALAQPQDSGGTLSRTPRTGSVDEAAGLANFERAQALIKEFEGGFGVDPKDPGGATNFGITAATLAAARGRPVTTRDVETMAYAEAKQIYLDLYWSRMNCGRLAGPLALAVYNIGVHCGVKTGGSYLQRALNAQGAALEVDGDIGDNTLAAASRADIAAVLNETIALYEARLRGHPNFAHFQNGFMRRVSVLRQESARWHAEAGAAPPPVPSSPRGPVMTQPTPQPLDLLETLRKIQELIAGIAPPPGSPAPANNTQAALIAILKANGLLGPNLPPDIGPVAEKPLTPVNAALGTTIGNLLDGKKSALGIIGAVLTQVAPQPVIDALKTALPAALVPATSGPLLALSLGMVMWGFLGKMEKLNKNIPTNQ